MYGPLGYFIVSPELVFLQACETIRNTAGWEQAFTEYMKGIHPGRMIASVRTEDVVGLPGVGIIANRSPLKRAVDYVLLRLLAAIGCEGGQYTPQILGYRRSPYIDIDEVCDRVCASRVVVPNAADLKLDIRNKWGGLPAVFQTVIRNTAAVGRDRRKVREAIRTQLADIGYRTSRGYQPTGHEKSLLLCYGNAGVEDGPGRTKAETDDGIAPVIGLAPHDSALVTQTWGEVQKVVHCGPFTKFFHVVSNKDRQELIVTTFPHAGPLTFHSGYSTAWGDLDQYSFESARTFEWDQTMQLAAAEEAGPAYNSTLDRPFIGVDPERLGTAASVAMPFSYDEEEVSVEVEEIKLADAATLHICEYKWIDPVRGQRVSSLNGATPFDLIAAKCVAVGDFGGTEHGMEDISSITMIDEAASQSWLDGKEFRRQVKDKITVQLPDGSGGLRDFTVDLSSIRRGFGDIEFLPAFTEFTTLPRKVLFTARPEEEAAVVLQANLTKQQALQGELTLRITLNYALVEQALGSSALPMGRSNVMALAKSLSGRATRAQQGA